MLLIVCRCLCRCLCLCVGCCGPRLRGRQPSGVPAGFVPVPLPLDGMDDLFDAGDELARSACSSVVDGSEDGEEKASDDDDDDDVCLCVCASV